MNQAVFAFRRYEDASLRYAGIESYEGLKHYGLYDTVIGRDQHWRLSVAVTLRHLSDRER